METHAISEKFDEISETYDSRRRIFIPCFDDFYGTSVDFLASIRNDFRSVLDLGAGTGLLTKYLHDRFKRAEFTLADVSDKMLKVARRRFEGEANVTYVLRDYSGDLPDGGFDLIASALSIHHLDAGSKASLYAKIYDRLDGGGCFINLDQFDSAVPRINDYYNKWWHEHIMNSGLPEKEVEAWRARRQLDKENTIDDTKRMLKDAGFPSVECIYSFMKFGVIIALK